MFESERKNRLSAFFLTVLIIGSVLCSCQSVQEAPETFEYINSVGEEWRKYTFSTETVEYDRYSNSGREYKGTGYRLIKKDNETGETSAVCIDPVCTHEPGSGCLLADEKGISAGTVVGDWLLYKVNTLMSGGTSLNIYNLTTGKYRQLVSATSDGAQISFKSYGNVLFIIAPNLVNGKTVYELKSYVPDEDKWKLLYSFDTSMYFSAVTNQRIYLCERTLLKAGDDILSVSFTHNGENLRDEPIMKMPIAFTDGDTCYVSAYRDLKLSEEAVSRVFAGYYMKYNLNTREAIRIPAEEGATALGIWKGKLVYATCKDVEEGVSLSTYEYSVKTGLDPSDPNSREAMNNRREEIFFGDRMYLKSCDMDGTNSETLFDYPGIFIDNGYISGDYMSVQISWINNDGLMEQGKARINLLTGEIENNPVSAAGSFGEAPANQ